jgi:hypothetical protein
MANRYKQALALRAMRSRIEDETGQHVHELRVNAAALLDDVIRALNLGESEAMRILILGNRAERALDGPIPLDGDKKSPGR